MSKELEGVLYRKLGDAIRQLRKSAKKTQDDLAKEIGVSRASIVNIEKGRHRPQLHLLYDLATSLGCEITDFLPAVNEMTANLPENLSARLNPEEKEPVAKLLRLAKNK